MSLNLSDANATLKSILLSVYNKWLIENVVVRNEIGISGTNTIGYLLFTNSSTQTQLQTMRWNLRLGGVINPNPTLLAPADYNPTVVAWGIVRQPNGQQLGTLDPLTFAEVQATNGRTQQVPLYDQKDFVYYAKIIRLAGYNDRDRERAAVSDEISNGGPAQNFSLQPGDNIVLVLAGWAAGVSGNVPGIGVLGSAGNLNNTGVIDFFLSPLQSPPGVKGYISGDV